MRPDAADLATRPMMPREGMPLAQTYPRSAAVYAPAAIDPATETETQWSPWGLFAPAVYFGEHDGLRGRLMKVAQADTYDLHANPWPNGKAAISGPTESLVWGVLIPRESSVHPGFMEGTK